MENDVMKYMEFDGWTVAFRGLPKEKEMSIPTLLCIGNGNIGIRGTVPELENMERKGMFVSGFFDKLPRPELDYSTFTPFLKSWSYENETKKYHLEEALVNCPDVLAGYFKSDNERFFFDEDAADKLYRRLDMRTGEVWFSIPVRTKSGRKGIVTRKRLVSMQRKETVFEECSFASVNFKGAVIFCASFDLDTRNDNISGIYQDTSTEKDRAYYRLYDVLEKEEGLYVAVRGRCNGYKLYMKGCADGAGKAVEIAPGEKLTVLRKSIVLCERIQSAGRVEAEKKLEEVCGMSYSEAAEENRAEWGKIWKYCDIGIDGDERIQTGLRHNLYLLNMSACRDSDRVSMAAKGLTGEGYRGMVFWDTDIHMFPFFLYTQPDAARNIVSFRCHTLDGAREKACRYGFRGASYPWETGTSGMEECEGFLKLITHQLHITADVAYAVGKYTENIQDEDFYINNAAELFIETARFWINRGYLDNGYFCVSQASGPDELHLESDNNAYVMNMVRHNLELADEAIHVLETKYPEKWHTLMDKTGLTEDEIEKISKYKDCIKTMKGEKGLYEQCEGFFNLEDRIVYENDPYTVPADTQTVKQADTLMMLYLLPSLVDKDELLENWNYYEPRTTHTSSLSYGVHGIIAAKLGLEEKAHYYLEKSMGLDLFNPVSNCADGAHLAAAGMSWSAVINGIAGIEFDGGKINISPFMPEKWGKMTFPLTYRGSRLQFELTHGEIKISNDAASDGTAVISYRDCVYRIQKGENLCLSI